APCGRTGRGGTGRAGGRRRCRPALPVAPAALVVAQLPLELADPLLAPDLPPVHGPLVHRPRWSHARGMRAGRCVCAARAPAPVDRLVSSRTATRGRGRSGSV